MNSTTVALPGFGEVGQILADDLSSVAGLALRAYDTRFDTDSVPTRAVRARPWVSRSETAEELARGSDVASTVAAAGIEPLMSNASATRQGWAARFPAALAEKESRPRLDSIRRELTC